MNKKVKAYRIQIPEPCHEGWQNMTPTEKGRHCKTCDKVVVDFSRMSDHEIIKFIEEKKVQNKRVCGHFKSNQIDRQMLQHVPFKVESAQRSQASGFLIVATLLSGLTFLSCNAQSNGGHHKVGKIAVHQEDVNQEKDTLNSNVQKFLVVSAINGKPIVNAKLTLNEQEYKDASYITDANGMVTIPWKGELKELSGTIAHADFEFYYFKVQKDQHQMFTVKMQDPILIDGMVEGEIEFIEEEPKKEK